MLGAGSDRRFGGQRQGLGKRLRSAVLAHDFGHAVLAESLDTSLDPYADRIVYMQSGRIVAEGRPGEHRSEEAEEAERHGATFDRGT
jgi:ABC-type hemin transport system ATPase subunit